MKDWLQPEHLTPSLFEEFRFSKAIGLAYYYITF